MTATTQPKTPLDFIEAGDLAAFGDALYTMAARGEGIVKVANLNTDWATITAADLGHAETDPADGHEAMRWCVLFNDIPECDGNTAVIAYLDPEMGSLWMQAISGPAHDHHVATRAVAAAIGASPIGGISARTRRRLDEIATNFEERHQVPPKAANDNAPLWPGLVSSGDMVSRFTPPDYAIDGIVQSGFLYGVTASTGTGKTAILLSLAALKAQGLPLGNRDLPQGRVVYFAGENPDDVTMRWIGAAHHTGFDTETIDVHFVPGVFDIAKMFEQVTAAVKSVGGAAMVIIDTSAAYFTGDDENGNVAMGKHARNLRQLTTLPGSPCVLVACHPTKNADQSNLLPRGGGAFIVELDGNLTCQKTEAGTIKLHWQGKFRGPDFRPIHFDLATVTAPGLVDSKGREIPTVMASLVSEGEARQRRETARKDEDLALIAIENLRSPSNAAIAEHLGWKDAAGEPHKRRAQTATTRLRRDKLAELSRDGWSLTKGGQTASTSARGAIARDGAATRLIANMAAKTGRTHTERTDGYGSPPTSSEPTEPTAFEPTEPIALES